MTNALELTIPADHPALLGHFPGHPIVPGVVILNVVFEALATQILPLEITGIKRLKFLQPLTPGQKFILKLVAQQPASARFQCWIAELLMVEGHVTLANRC